MEPLAKLNPAFKRNVVDERAGLKGFLVIDRQVNGAATGGVRMASGVTLEEVANLAHEMTLKYGILKIKKDGAKAGIVAPPDMTPQQKGLLCRRFGELLRDLIAQRRYFPGEDLGIAAPDLAEIMAGAGISLAETSPVRSEYFTALTVFLTLRTVLADAGRSLDRVSIIVEGFGKVAEQFSAMLAQAGARVTGISTVHGALFDPAGLDTETLSRLKAQHGDKLVDHYDQTKRIGLAELIVQEADVFIPGARPDSINAGNVRDIKAGVIVPIANIAATEEIEEMLHARKIIYVPGFVANAGGILGHFLSEQGFAVPQIETIIRQGFPRLVRRVLSRAREGGRSVARAAREMAMANLAAGEAQKGLPLIKKVSPAKLLWILFKLSRKANLDFILRPFAMAYIQRKVFDKS